MDQQQGQDQVLKIELKSSKKGPQFYHIAAMSYPELVRSISNDFGIDPKSLALSYIDEDRDESVLDSTEAFNYLKKTMKGEIQGIIKSTGKKGSRENKKFASFEYMGPDKQIFQFKYEQGSAPSFKAFLEQVQSRYGRKCYKIKYVDEDGDECNYDTGLNLDKASEEAWKIMMDNMTPSSEVEVQIIYPTLKGDKNVWLHLSETRKAAFQMNNETSFSDVAQFVFQQFNQKYFSLTLDSYPKSKGPISEESSWKQAKNHVYDGSIFFIQDYKPIYIMNFTLKKGKSAYSYEINRNQAEGFENFIENCRKQFFPASQIEALSYFWYGQMRYISKQSDWVKFKQEAVDGVQVFVKLVKQGSSANSSLSGKLKKGSIALEQQPFLQEDASTTKKKMKKQVAREKLVAEEPSVEALAQKMYQEKINKYHEKTEKIKKQAPVKIEAQVPEKNPQVMEEDSEEESQGSPMNFLAKGAQVVGKMMSGDDQDDDNEAIQACDACSSKLSKTYYRKCLREGCGKYHKVKAPARKPSKTGNNILSAVGRLLS